MKQKIQPNSEVSRRYSKALFKIANEQKSEKKIYNEIKELLELLSKEKNFIKLFSSPLLSAKDQLKLINNLFSFSDKKKIKVSKNIFAFLRVLANNGRLKELFGVLNCFEGLVKSMYQEVNISLTTAKPINDAQLVSLKNILSKKTDKKININSNVDKKIIGGIILQSGSNLIDASIRNKILKLNNIKKGVN